MAGEQILLTGGTGHLGYATLVEALSKGYNVRAAVRSESKIALLKAARPSQPYLDQLSFVIVPNIEIDGAFDEAVKGVDYVVHVASPLGKDVKDLEADMIQPAIRGTLSILYSALRAPSVKKVVITSSVVAVMPSEPKIFNEDNVDADPTGPYSDPFVAYCASKKLAYNRTRDFIAKEKPAFSVINVMPTFVVGKNVLAQTPAEVASGSNAIALAPILGTQNPGGMPAFACHVDDVAHVHIAPLDPKIQGHQNFGVNYDVKGINWDEGLDIVKKHFPKEVEKGIFPLGGTQTSLPTGFDASKTERVLGFKFKNYEDMIVSLAGHYAEVSAKA